MTGRPFQLGVPAGDEVVEEEVVVLARLQEELAAAVVQDLQVLVAAEPSEAVHDPVHCAEWGGEVGARAGAGVAEHTEVRDAARGVEQTEESPAEMAAAEAAEERRGGADAEPPLAHRRGDGEARLGREADEDLTNAVISEVIE